MRGSSVHATWPRLDSGHSWSFSSINSVVPRSHLPLPQAVRDAERRTGEPGVALLAGVRGENSPHLLGNIEEGKSKNYFFYGGVVMFRTIDGTRIPMASFSCPQVDTAAHIPKGPNG
jgi:hypothetical protein